MPVRPSLLPEYEDCIGVFQGGGCRTAAYAGAYSAAIERGVNFTEVAGTSAGAIAAALVAAGASPEELETMLTSLDFKTFLKRPHGFMASRAKGKWGQGLNLLRFNGMYNSREIADWVEKNLSELLASHHAKVRFSDLPRPVSVLAANLTTHQPIVWSTEDTPDASVADAVRASCTIPFFFQPYNNLVDGGVLSNLPLHLVHSEASDRRRVLAFSLVDSDPSDPPRDALATGLALASTVTEGSKELQRSLSTTVDVISIRCEGVKATDFRSMNDEKVRALVAAGRHAVEEFLGAGVTAVNPTKPPQVSSHLAQTFAVAANNILFSQDTVVMSLAIGQASGHTNWFFDLYTAVLLGRMRGVKVRVLLEHSSGARDVGEQVATLQALGCAIAVLERGERLPVEAIICDPGTLDATAVILSHPGMEIHARMLSAKDGDSATIDLVSSTLLERTTEAEPGPSITLRRAPAEEVVDALKAVREYTPGDVSIALEYVPMDQIDSRGKIRTRLEAATAGSDAAGSPRERH